MAYVCYSGTLMLSMIRTSSLHIGTLMNLLHCSYLVFVFVDWDVHFLFLPFLDHRLDFNEIHQSDKVIIVIP